MKKRLYIRPIVTMLSIAGLALLLLVSPCKVRNFMQSKLGVSQTQALNKSQSTISQFGCFSVEISQSDETLIKPSITVTKLLFNAVCPDDFTGHFYQYPVISPPSKYLLISDVPLYILYRNLKIYS